MRILLVAYQFPPYSNVGSLRIGKFTKFLEQKGHDVRALTASNIAMPATMPIEIDPSHIIATPWFNVNFLPELFFGGRQTIVSKGYQTKSSPLKKLGYLYRLFFNFPDERIGWYPYAVAAGKKLLRNWKADVIYASSPTPTALMIANMLSKRFGIPWIAEYRDIWTEEEYYAFPKWRLGLEKKLEKKTLSTMAGMVTVTEPWASFYQATFHKPVVVAMNGVEFDDYPVLSVRPTFAENTQKNLLNICYTGSIHEKQFDIDLLFSAIQLLKEDSHRIQLHFYTRYIDHIQKFAGKYNLDDIVIHHPIISYKETLRILMQSDILLYFVYKQWGRLPVKIFEYIGALRPILGIGNPSTVSSEIILDRSAGFVSDSDQKIADQLRKWMDEKFKSGVIKALPEKARDGLSRQQQYQKIEEFLQTFLQIPKSR